MNPRHPIRCLLICAVLTFSSHALPAFADDTQDLKKELDQMREQNRLMQQQLEKQQQMIDELNRKVAALPSPGTEPAEAVTAAAHSASNAGLKSADADADASGGGGFSMGNARLSGEGGVGFFETGKNGYFPTAQTRVDEARLFLDAPLWNNVYFYGELNLFTREGEDDGEHLGELYLEFEDLAHLWGQENLLNVRAGQFYIPFGEEYQVRYAIDNPLISHSLSDIWGLSSGVEAYGAIKKVSYALAVQSGGISVVDDNEADKSVAGRLGYDPASWLHLSASAMRTGDVNASEDHVSALWFGNGFFQSIGSKNTTLFHADLAEVDGRVKWHQGSLKVAGGYADYNDDDPAADNHRDIYYYYGELVQGLTEKLYGAVRVSQIDAAKGYPLRGDGSNDFGIRTTQLWRVSIGAGYRFNQHLLLKAEYMLEHGRQTDGSPRNHEDMFALEGAFKF